MRRSLSVLMLLALVLQPGVAGSQGSGKKPLTQDTYDIWRNIQGASLSPDGRWAVYTLTPVVGDGEVVIRSTEGATEYRIPRGWTGRPAVSVTVDTPFVAPPAQFSADSRFVLFLGYAPKAEYDLARQQRRPAAQQPRPSLGIVDLSTGNVTSIPSVRAFRLARESGRFVFYHLEAQAAARDTGAARTGPAPDSARVASRRRELGSDLVVRELATGAEVRIAEVSSFVVEDSGRWLAYAVASRTPENDGVYLRNLSSGDVATVMRGEGDYRQLAFDRSGTQLAFVSNRDDFKSPKPRGVLYYATVRQPAAVVAVPADGVEGLSPALSAGVSFTRDGSTIVFGVAPPPLDTIPQDSLVDKAVFDLWHWKDSRLQPQQRLEAGRDRNRSYTSAYNVRSRRVTRLANDSMPQAQLSDDGKVALVVTRVPYMIEAMWGEDGSDVYVVDVPSGRATPIARKVDFGASLSPAGRYVFWYDKGAWHSYSVSSGRTVTLTAGLAGIRFDQRGEWDTPSAPPAWGVAGWLPEDRSVLVYDAYDIWELDPSGTRAPRMVTDSLGTRRGLRLRLVDLDPEDRFIDPTQPLLLRAFDLRTKASGFFRDWLDRVALPEQIVMADRNFGTPQRARKAERYLLTQQTVAEFPDLWVGPSLTSLTRISNANPQQAEYLWPTVELVEWLSADGVPLQGLLYKPEGFDPSSKYPMIVYFYERLSDGLHNYVAPAGRNVINATVYTSLGYLVFMPDIVYEIGWPGPSAVKCVVPGVQALIARGFVDPKAIGIAGQSWGGYQTAYIITQTNLFAAAVPNAPVANMTSAYGGIRWGSGLARPFQYEKTQSRIGGSIWEYPIRFIENSPLFHLDRVTTPVFFMHNDADDAVPWYQGIELFVALRRLGKEVYFISYNGDVHNPRKRANQKDIDMRMQQFFATKLKGEPAPDWMVRGIPYLEKGRDQIAPAGAAAQPAQGRLPPR
jgi:dipeptidyl aminopeptidase/acylaminoacyl peptidase